MSSTPDFETWARTRQAALRRTAFLLCGDWESASDLVQETFARMYPRWGRFGDVGGAEAYARRVLTNAFVDTRRRRSSGERPVALVPEGPVIDTDDPALRLVLLDALARLPVSQRAVLVLRYWDDLSVTQAAQVLGCSEGNIKSQASRGLVALRQRLAEAGVDLVAGPDPAIREGGPGGGTGADGLVLRVAEAFGLLLRPGAGRGLFPGSAA